MNRPVYVNCGPLPEHIREGARLYIEHGIKPGGFLSAVICNDLRAALAKARPATAKA